MFGFTRRDRDARADLPGELLFEVSDVGRLGAGWSLGGLGLLAGWVGGQEAFELTDG